MILMMKTGVIPACARDLQGYATTNLSGVRPQLYKELADQTDNVQMLLDLVPHGDEKAAAHYCCNVVLPAMLELRTLSDKAELECADNLWPYPKYTDIFFAHHTEAPLV